MVLRTYVLDDDDVAALFNDVVYGLVQRTTPHDALRSTQRAFEEVLGISVIGNESKLTEPAEENLNS